MSYTPLRFGFLKADGVKVRNMIASFALNNNYILPMSNHSSDMRFKDINVLKIF